MFIDRTVVRSAVLLVIVSAALAGCDDSATPAAPARPTPDAAVLQRSTHERRSEIRRDLAALRRLTAPFHRFDRATHAGWTLEVTPCMDMPPLGGMGYHYGNPEYIDGAVNVLEPELLMYEPGPRGQMRLVGVEYIVPLSAWQGSKPPMLFGREFQVNEQFGVWALHAWVWKHNPAGMFADWNPNVSCTRAR